MLMIFHHLFSFKYKTDGGDCIFAGEGKSPISLKVVRDNRYSILIIFLLLEA